MSWSENDEKPTPSPLELYMGAVDGVAIAINHLTNWPEQKTGEYIAHADGHGFTLSQAVCVLLLASHVNLDPDYLLHKMLDVMEEGKEFAEAVMALYNVGSVKGAEQ